MTKGREAIYIEPNNMAQIERMRRYYQMIAKQTGRSVRPFRGDGYVNLVTQLGNNRNNQAPVYRPELLPSDTELAALYEGSGLFSKIIDAPAEEAIKHGFELQDVTDAKINDFISEALDELEWENTAATAIKWSRLFGGSIIVMLIDDGRGIDEPLDWKNIKSIDELRVFERAIVVPDETSMYRYVPGNPLGGNRYGEPEFYTVSSRYGFFNVHESRCLVFRNGRVPEFSANSIYQLWGIPEYVRMKQALANSELAYGSAPKMLERCVQAVYKMKNLAEELSTEDGEQNVLKRLEVIDLARGLLNSIAIDNEGEDYDFKTFSFTGVADVIDSTCNMLSAVSNIPQTILFGRSPAGMNATGTSDLENWYNYIERVQKTQVKKNLRYLLSVIFQAGMYHGEIDEIPKIKISFNPLWSLSEQDKANVDKVKADTELVRANTANLYIQAEVISSDEVRSALAKTDEFDIETMLDDMEDDENLMTSIHDPVSDPDGGEGEENSGADVTDNTDPTAPDATKIPAENENANLPTEPKRSDGNDYDDFPEYGMWLEEHMEATREEQKAAEEHYKALKKAGNRQHSNRDNQSTKEQKTGGVGVIVVKDGKILCGKRHNDTGYGLLCGPGGHVEHGETAEQAAIRETQEEFGITPKNIIQLGYGPKEPETGIAPAIFLCTEYDGEPECDDLEMVAPQFLSLDELEAKAAEQYQPFKDGVVVLLNCLKMNHDGDSAFFGSELNSIKPGSYDVMRPDGGEGSGNFGHKGRPGEIGGSAESHQLGGMKNGELASKMKDVFGKAKVGTHFSIQMEGPVGKEAYEAFKTSDGYYLRSKKGSNKIIASDDKLVEGCGVYVVEATKNRTMYKKADIQIGEPETDEAKKFAEDYASFQKAKERLQAGETQISEVSDDVAKQYADTLNKASKGKIAKIAAEDPQFKAVVDNISAYTQGEYIFQRKTVEGVVENGYDPSKDAILGDRLTDSAFSCKDMYQGQNLSVSSASVAEGMTNLSKAVKCSEPYEGELYRVAQDRSVLFEQDSGRQGVYVPPAVGETIKITAPTSFSKDRAAVDKIAKDKMGDIIYYTVEPGAHAVDVSKLSPYKQAELLSCGDYEVVKVESEPRTSLWDREDKFTSETLETLKQHRGATVSDGYVTYPVLTTHITLRQTNGQNSDSADDHRTSYRLDDFSERMVQSTETDGGSGSGNFGHAGVPGQVGGSAPNGFDSSNIAAYERGAKLSKSQKDRALGIAGASALGANSSSAVRFIEDHGEIRTVVKTDKGEVDIRIKPESKSAYLEMVYANKKNGGNGAEIISDIVANSRSQGLEKIDAYGAGENGSSYNGYYSLPRLGFDAPIPDDLKSGLKEAGISAANISDLMGSDAGRAWWKNNGHGTDMTFDLSDGSTSLHMLSSYLNRDSIDEATDNTLNGDGGPGSGNFGHEGVPGQVGGSAPAGAASSAASAEKVSTLKENFGNLKQNQKYAYLGRTGIVPKGELDSLKAGVASSDQKAIAKLAEYEETYFNLAEYGSEAKSLKVEMRDDVAAMSDEDAAAWAKQSMDRRLESHEGWANQYSAAQKVAIDMGVYETPQVVSQEDFDKYVKESGAAVCYRGVKDIDSMTGENMMFQMAYNTQEPYYGDGIFGDGLYFSTRKETAEGYAGRAAIATCAVRPDAKILEYGSPEHEKAKKRVQTTDDSVAALCSGYDVIHKKMGGNEDYYVILNRAALVMVDPVSKQGDLAIRAAQKNAGRSNGDSTRVSPENNMGNLDNRGKNATIKVQKTHTDGGLGSGDFGHAGRTGKVGGSASGESSIEVEGSSGKKAKMSIPAIDTGDAAAEVKNGRHNSLEKYIDSDGNLSPERQALHAEIVSGYFEGKEKVDGVRTATFLGGGPASGKSSLRDSGLIVQADDPSTVTIDPDGLKGKLPGYEEMASETDSAAAFYHEESSAVAKTLYSTALDYGCNTVYDGTGDGSVNSMRKKIKDAHDAGYKAVGEYVTVDVDEALRRNELRYEAAKEKYEKGLSKVPPRLPDAKIVKSIHRKVTDISVECASEFDSIKIYDNNGARGSAPTLIATGGNGKPLSAVNKPLLQKYLDKGEKKWKIDEKGEVVPG